MIQIESKTWKVNMLIMGHIPKSQGNKLKLTHGLLEYQYCKSYVTEVTLRKLNVAEGNDCTS